jgi:hypothetical protein
MNLSVRRWITTAVVFGLLLLATTCGIVASNIIYHGGHAVR